MRKDISDRRKIIRQREIPMYRGMEQSGGMVMNPRVIPQFKDGKQSNPFITNDQRVVKNMLTAESGPRVGQAPAPDTLFEFKINDKVIKYPEPKTRAEDPFKAMMNEGIYPSPYVPIPNPLYPNMGNPMYPWSYVPNNNVPLIKKYNISISNAGGDLTKLHDLYEDVLPSIGGIVQKSLTTLAERTIIYQYLRSIFIKHNDGENISIGVADTSQKSELTNLLSHIKLMEINPYHFSRITTNPYKTLPENFLMFRSCYPVRLNRNNGLVTCAPDNLGIHIRIYQMRVLDILADTFGEKLKKNDCDLWREMAYYEYITEKILKPKKCPNFIMMFAWYKTLKSGVDFIKLRSLKQDKTTNIRAIEDNIALLNSKIRDDMARILMEVGNGIGDINNLNKLKRQQTLNGQTYAQNQNALKVYKSNIKLADNSMGFDLVFKDEDLTQFNVQFPTNKCIVSITEAPNHNLFDWGTKSYSVDMGPIKKMVQTGYHDIKVWQSIVFQLLAALYVMVLENIAINEMSIEDNVYIKDLTREESQVGYWKYKINGIDYYIPNFGYLVLIDSKFNEITGGIENVTLQREYVLKYKYKVYGEIFEDTPETIFNTNKENILKIFNDNTFGQGFTSHGGIKPPTEILNMFADINRRIQPVKNVDELKEQLNILFVQTQSHFLHNRIGKYLKDIEKDQLIKDDKRLIKGTLVAEVISGVGQGNMQIDSHKWVLYVGKDTADPTLCDVYGSDIKNYTNSKNIMRQVSVNNIFSTTMPAEQDFKPNQKLVEDDLLETYIIS